MESITLFLIFSCVVIFLLALLLFDAYTFNRKLKNKIIADSEQIKNLINNANTKTHDGGIKKIEELNKALSDAQNIILNLEYSLKDEREKKIEQIVATESNYISPTTPVEYTYTQIPISTQTQSNIKFARYADQVDGFSVSELLNEENDETIFQLTQESFGTATFRISNNQNAQKYALSNVTYLLGKSCKYDSTPSSNSYIKTDVVGDLKLQGTKWLIVNPAKISFS